MATLLRRAWGSVKPPPGSTINGGHDLAQGMVGCWLFNDLGAGLVPNLVMSPDRLTLSGNAAPTTDGLRSPATGSASGALLTTPSRLLQPAKNLTVLWRGLILGAATNVGNNPPLIAMAYDNAGGSPFISYGIHRTADTNSMFAAWNNGGFLSASYAAALASRLMTPVQFVLTINGDDAKVTLYDGAKIAATSATASTISYSATAMLTVSRHVTDGTAMCNTVTHEAVVWNRALTAAEVALLAIEPYGFITPPGPKILYFSVAGPVVTNAPAGVAAATASAYNASVTVAPNAGLASATGAAQAPAASVSPAAGIATGIGAANSPSTSIAPPAGIATGTGAAQAPAASVKPNAGTTAATGAAQTPGTTVAGTAGIATGTGAAAAPGASLQASAGSASATGAARAPAISLLVNVGIATGIGQAYGPGIIATVLANAGLASGAGAAYNATVKVMPNAGLATAAIAIAYDPSTTSVVVTGPGYVFARTRASGSARARVRSGNPEI